MYPACYYGTKASKVGRASHNTPVLSFRQPKQSLEHLKVLGGRVKDKVGRAVDKVKQKLREKRAKKEQGSSSVTVGRVQVERSLFRYGPAVPDDEESPAGQDLHHPHPHYQVGGGKGSSSSSRGVASGSTFGDDMGPALFVLGRTQSFDTALLREVEGRQRRALSYGNVLVNFVGFAIKALTLLLFQVLGAALVVNEYQVTGLVSQTLIKFASLLAGLAFVPPLVVAVRESLPAYARNPLVRAISRVFELALDVVSVAALSLLASVLLTAVMSLPSYNFLLSRQLGEEYIKGALSAASVLCFLWLYSRNFEPLATKWFM